MPSAGPTELIIVGVLVYGAVILSVAWFLGRFAVRWLRNRSSRDG
jgi:predicted permease